MSSRNRDKRIQNRQNRQTGMEEARRRARRRRWEIASGGIVLAIIIAIAFAAKAHDDNKTASPTTTTLAGTTTTVAPTSSTAALKSVAGKPCVPESGAYPKGAFKVPVQTGPPPTTLLKKDLRIGTGAVVRPGASVTVDYVGVACSTGKIFDSSYQDSGPASFSLAGGVITGWTDGIPGMRVGGQRLLGIPPADAYGPSGRGALIAPGETLWFVVQVVKTS